MEYGYELEVVVVTDSCPKCVLQPNHIAYSGIWHHNSYRRQITVPLRVAGSVRTGQVIPIATYM